MQIHLLHCVFVLVYLGLAGRCEPNFFPLDANGVPGHCCCMLSGVSPVLSLVRVPLITGKIYLWLCAVGVSCYAVSLPHSACGATIPQSSLS